MDKQLMGVSRWKEYGKKYGYWNYFVDQLLNDMQAKCDREENEEGRLLIEWARKKYATDNKKKNSPKSVHSVWHSSCAK